jgi:ribosomal protein S18 acetylase RimI-like enzyme
MCTSMNVEVRRIMSGEWELYRQLRLASLEESPHAFSSTLESALLRSDESWKTQAGEASHGRDRAIFLAFCEDGAIGLAAIYRDVEDSQTAELFQVWVSSFVRNRGIATNLIDSAREWADEGGIQRIRAEVTRTNGAASQLYLKYGFRQVAETGREPSMVFVLTNPG